jgi:hypothetical protein
MSLMTKSVRLSGVLTLCAMQVGCTVTSPSPQSSPSP